MSARPLLEVDGLGRSFGGVKAVDGISFRIAAGQVLGLIGANGAGKTTLMRILATLDLPDRGAVYLDGIDIVEHPNAVRPRIGWMPDHFSPYRDMTVADYLDFFGRAQGLSAAELDRRVEETADFTDLVRLAERPCDRLSKGELQRLCLARTLIKDPEFLILDEPAAGLDPKARLEFKNLVRILRDRGKTILISSHILSELGEMCDTMIFMDKGGIVHHGDTEVLRRGNPLDESLVMILRVHGPLEPLLTWFPLRPGWRVLEELQDGVRAEFAGAIEALPAEVRRMTADGIELTAFHRVERRLEEAFVEMLRK